MEVEHFGAHGAGPHHRACAPGVVDNTVHDLVVVAKDLRRHIDLELAGRGYDVRRPAFSSVLDAVWDGPLPQARLADLLGVTVQAASQTVGLAAAAGFVDRRPNPDDRRSKLVAITDRGRRFVEHGVEALIGRGEHYAALVGVDALAVFRRDLDELAAGLGLQRASRLVTQIDPRADLVAVALVAGWATERLRRAMVEDGHGRLRPREHELLVHIGPGGVRASELARVQRVSRQAVTSVLHQGEAKGYLGRRVDEGDGRGVVFELTPLGRRVVSSYVAGIDLVVRRVVAELGEDGASRLARTARDLRHRLTIEALVDTGDGDGAGAFGSVRSDDDLRHVAVGLRAWLGEADAARLGVLLGEPPARSTRSR